MKTAEFKAKLRQCGLFFIENGETIAQVLIFAVACVKAYMDADKKPRQ